MAASVGRIVERQKGFPIEPAAERHFTLADMQPVEPNLVVREPGWSLYSLDAPRRTVTFVALPVEVDLGKSAFAYATQFDRAERALQMSFGDFLALAETLPDPPNPVFVFSIGRCGSTLLSRMLAGVPGVWSLSEPDAPTNMAAARAVLAPSEKAALARAQAQVLFRPPAGMDVSTFVIKFRSFSIFDLKPWLTAFPGARHLFLWRDAAGWANSISLLEQAVFPGRDLTTREFLDLRWEMLTAGASRDLYARYDDLSLSHGNSEAGLAAIWALSMEQLMGEIAARRPLVPMSYASLNGAREASVALLLDACGLPAAMAERALRAYDRHSQDDSLLADARHMPPMTGDQRRRVLEALAGHPALSLA
jgi:hypothetical protein